MEEYMKSLKSRIGEEVWFRGKFFWIIGLGRATKFGKPDRRVQSWRLIRKRKISGLCEIYVPIVYHLYTMEEYGKYARWYTI